MRKRNSSGGADLVTHTSHIYIFSISYLIMSGKRTSNELLPFHFSLDRSKLPPISSLHSLNIKPLNKEKLTLIRHANDSISGAYSDEGEMPPLFKGM